MTIWQFDAFIYDSRSGELSDGQHPPVVLRNKVAKLLTYLLQYRERPVSKEELLDRLWQHGDYRERSLTQSIRELRQALGDSAATAQYIRTLPGRGYQWIATTHEVTPKPVNTPVRRKRHGLLAAVCIAVLSMTVIFWSAFKPAAPVNTSATPSLAVLPFTNDTADPSFDWLQLGYADMLGKALASTGRVSIVPPSAAAELLASAGLDWPTLPVYVRGLLQEHNIDAALIASVRWHNQAQVMDFQILRRNGQVQQGSLTYPSLTDATAQVAGQLLGLVAPNGGTNAPELTLKGDTPEQLLARRVMAEGISALQTDGPVRADELFQAANLLVKDNPWIGVYRSQSEILKGEWAAAESRLKQLLTDTKDPQLQAVAEFWAAQLAFRQGRDAEADQHLARTIEQAQDAYTYDTLAKAYYLKAEIAWLEQRWSDYHQWRDKASKVLPANNDLAVQASRLLYLGNPVGEGLEGPPINSDQQQQAIEQLKRALAFYQALDNRPQVASTHLALARNDALPQAPREKHLQNALEQFALLAQPYELADAHIYAAFYYLQSHRGQAAYDTIVQAQKLTAHLADYRNRATLDFYRAFALLDQGLDQTHRGLHPQRSDYLTQAIAAFSQLLQSPTPGSKPLPVILQSQSLVLQGWGLASMGRTQEALENYHRAMELSRPHNLTETFGYAVYSAMHVHLRLGQYQSVLALAELPVHTRQQLAYLARAHYELEQYEQAVNTLQRLQETFPQQWGPQDAERLAQYQQVAETQQPLELSNELPAHGIYCESDWLMMAQ